MKSKKSTPRAKPQPLLVKHQTKLSIAAGPRVVLTDIHRLNDHIIGWDEPHPQSLHVEGRAYHHVDDVIVDGQVLWRFAPVS